MKVIHKNWILLLIASFLFSACSPPSADSVERIPKIPLDGEPIAEATPVASAHFSPKLRKIEMLDEQNGWGHAEGMILRTEDGGESWLNITPTAVDSDPVYAESVFLDEETGWILIESPNSPDVSTLFRTNDGGATWLSQNTPFGRTEIGFLDAENGYGLTSLGAAAGSMGVAIWETKNSGESWERVFLHEVGLESSLPFSGTKNGLSFVDPLNGWVGGSTPQDGFIWLYRTEDGGLSWEHQNLSMPPSYEFAQASVDAPLFFAGGQGLLPVQLRYEESATVFYRTIDGGENWLVTTPVATRGKYAVASATEIIVWDGSSEIYSSLDGGENWTSTPSDWHPADTLRALDFVSATHGWAISDEAGFFRTVNGGMSWEKLGE